MEVSGTSEQPSFRSRKCRLQWLRRSETQILIHLAESDDLDCLADFLKSWDVPESSIRKSLQILVMRSHADLQRSDFVEPVPVDCDVAPCELSLDVSLMKKLKGGRKSSKEKQQAGNRGRSELLGSDHKQARLQISLTVTGGLLHIAFWQEELFGWFTVWDAATCFLGLIIYPLHTQVNSFRPPMRMTACANGVPGLHSQRQTRGPQVRTLRLLLTSEFTL